MSVGVFHEKCNFIVFAIKSEFMSYCNDYNYTGYQLLSKCPSNSLYIEMWQWFANIPYRISTFKNHSYWPCIDQKRVEISENSV